MRVKNPSVKTLLYLRNRMRKRFCVDLSQQPYFNPHFIALAWNALMNGIVLRSNRFKHKKQKGFGTMYQYPFAKS